MMILITTNFSTEQIKFHGCKCVTRFFFFSFFFAWIYSNFRTRIWHWNLSPWFQIYEKICDTRRMFLYDIVRKGSFIAVDACHWTLCVTVSVIDSCLCRVGVSKFGGERDRGIVCSLSARIQCTWDSADRCMQNVYSVFLISAKILRHVRHIPLLLRATGAISLCALELIFTVPFISRT